MACLTAKSGRGASTAPAFDVGEATVRVFNVGDFPVDMKEIFGPDVELSRYFGPGYQDRKTYFPSNSMFVSSGPIKLVVDPGDTARLTPADAKADPRHAPSPLVGQLARIGVEAEEITHVVVTHLHFDHFVGITRTDRGERVLTFPNAEHILPKKDWQMPDIVDARKRKDKDLSETLGVAERLGRLEFLDERKVLGRGVEILPSPGESPGHQSLAVSSGTKRCYCIGDLYHVKEEVENPELMAPWTLRGDLLVSRKEFAERAAREGALVLPAHMPPGRIRIRGRAPVWSEF